MCIDSTVMQDITFTPAMTLKVLCDSEEEIEVLFEKLSGESEILMPLTSYTFSEKFSWRGKWNISPGHGGRRNCK